MVRIKIPSLYIYTKIYCSSPIINIKHFIIHSFCTSNKRISFLHLTKYSEKCETPFHFSCPIQLPELALKKTSFLLSHLNLQNVNKLAKDLHVASFHPSILLPLKEYKDLEILGENSLICCSIIF